MRSLPLPMALRLRARRGMPTLTGRQRRSNRMVDKDGDVGQA